MINKIAHFSDIHIRKSISRHNEYKSIFKKVYQKLKEQKPDRIVIVGDLYHDYIDLEGEAEVLMGEFLNDLSKLTDKVIITRGNHDLRKKQLSRKDTVETITTLINNPKVVYYNKSGFYEDENITWVVHNHREDVNPWVSIKHERNIEQVYIDLYHDPIQGCKVGDGHELKTNKYSVNDFKGDYSFLGDIHLYQTFNKGRIVYPSSLIQQDFGETVENHGYVLWDIKDKNDFISDYINIPNDFNYINFYLEKDTDYDNLDLTHPSLNDKSQIKIHWNDLSANTNFENELKIRNYFKQTYNIIGIKISRNPIYTDVSDVEMVNETIDILDPEVHRKIFIEFLELNGYKKEFIEKILEIDSMIEERLDLSPQDNLGVSWSIDEFWFDYFKSYGKDNRINWKKKDGIYQISGINQQGKTTILDAISYILYGKTSTTIKREKNGDNRYLNNKLDINHTEGGAHITINDEVYTIVRRTERKWNKTKTEISSCSTNVDYWKGTELTDENKLTDEDKVRTQEFIDSAIGDFGDFIRLVLTNADNLNEILSMDRAVFIDSIIKDAGYDIFEKKLEEFKSFKKIKTKDDIKIDLVNSKNDLEEKKTEVKEIKERKKRIEEQIKIFENEKPSLQKEKDDLLSSMDKIDETISALDLDDIGLNIESEKNKIKTRNDQLNKIEDLKLDILSYDSDKTKNKRIELDKLKDDLSEKNSEISKIENKITDYNHNINIINKDMDNIISDYIRNLESDIKNEELNLNKIKDNFSNKVIEYSSVLKEDLNNIVSQKNSYKKDINSLMDEGKKLKNLNSELENSKICLMCERTLDDVNPEIINKKIEDNKTEMSKLVHKVKELKPKYEELSNSIDGYQNKLDKLSKKEYDFDDDLYSPYQDYLEKEKQFNISQGETERRINLIKDHNYPIELQDKLKPSSDEKTNLSDKINHIKSDIKKSNNEITIIDEKVESLKTEVEELEKKDSIYQKKKDAIALEEKVKYDIEKSENLIIQYKKDIEDYNNQLDKIEGNKKIKENISLVESKIVFLENEIKSKMDSKSKTDSEIAVLDNDIENIKKNIRIFEKQKERDEIYNIYLSCVHRDGLPSYLLKKSISLINQELSNLLIDVDFNLFFDNELNLKMSHNIKIESSQNAIESSGKERSFAAIVLKQSLRKINKKSKPNFILLDELMGKLLGESVEEFIKLLDTIKKDVDKLVIIEHIYPINYDYLIEVDKDNKGVSSLKIN